MPKPLYRLQWDAESLLREHPPKLRHPHKAALFEMAFPDGSRPRGRIEVTRWPQHVEDPADFSGPLQTDVRPGFFDYVRVGRESDVEWHVNFADPRLFVAYGSALFAQDEMQVAEHPALASVREALLARGLPALTEEPDGPTPVLVTNVERRIEVRTDPDASAGRPDGLYGNRFAAAPLEVVRRAVRRIDPPRRSHLIAMAAPACGRGEYTEGQIRRIFLTAFTAFAAAVNESRRLCGSGRDGSRDTSGDGGGAGSGDAGTGARGDGGGAGCGTIIHSGFWGCGAFGGNRTLMTALQALAARAAGVSRLVLHAGDGTGPDDARLGLDVAADLVARCGLACPLDELVARAAMLGYRWGVSDGN